MSTLPQAMLRGSMKAVADKAAPFIPPRLSNRQATIINSIPWRDWNYIGRQIGSLRFSSPISLQGFDSQEGYIIVNNSDSNLYIGSYGSILSTINDPILFVPPFSSGFLTTELPTVNAVADCFGYDFSTKRVNVALGDTRFSNGVGIEIKTGNSDTPLPKLRSTWTRIYDAFDLVTGWSPFPNFVTTGAAWSSDKLALEGSSGCTFYTVSTTDGATGSALLISVTDSFPTNNQGSFNMQNGSAQVTPTGGGTFYLQFTVSGTATPSPVLSWTYLAGGTAGVHATLVNALITVAMSS